MRHKSEELMKQIMDYAEQFQLLNHRSPYTSEIADALGIVKSTVYKYLVAMNDRGMLSYRNGEIVTERTNKISLLTKPAAVLGSVSCGMPQLEEEYIEEYVSLPVSLFGEGEFFILRASGDSMIGAGINSGCTLNTICSELEKENPQKNLLKTTIRSLDSFLSIANGKVIIYKYSRWYFTVFLGCSDPYSYTSCFL